MCFTATGATTLTAIGGADKTIFIVVAGSVAATTTNAIATVESSNFLYTDFVPGVVATEGVLLADASLNCRVFTARPFLDLAAGAGSSTRPTVFGTSVAGLARGADAVTAVRSSHAFTAPKGLDFRSTGEVPATLTTP